MKKTEAIKMLQIAEGAYPNFRPNDKQLMVDIWAELFANEKTESAMLAMRKHCANSKYFPCVADVKAEINGENAFMKGYIKC